jgi:hypothetical protein
MYDRSRLTRLITCALASCAATWALAATAPAQPDPAGVAVRVPAFAAAVPGGPNAAPGPSTAPAYQPQIGDHLAQANAGKVERVRAGSEPLSADNGGGDHMGTIALVAAIAALVAAVGAVALAAVRAGRPALGA